MKTGRYVEGATNRQKALDYINAHPNQTGPEIIEALGWDKVGGSDRLGKMYLARELDRVRCQHSWINANGKKFNITTYRYTARVIKTRGADEVLQTMAENLKSDGQKAREKEAKAKTRPAWVSGPTNPDRKPIPNQDGQGSGRSRVWVGSSAGLV